MCRYFPWLLLCQFCISPQCTGSFSRHSTDAGYPSTGRGLHKLSTINVHQSPTKPHCPFVPMAGLPPFWLQLPMCGQFLEYICTWWLGTSQMPCLSIMECVQFFLIDCYGIL
jgi:hypothetical protein